MSACKTFVLFTLLSWCSAYNIEVNTKTVVKTGLSQNSLFGFSLTLHNGLPHFKQKPTIFVGAPLGDGSARDRGEFVECVIDEPDCDRIKLDRLTRVASYEHREKQWMGASVSSNGEGPIIVCAPRYSEVDGDGDNRQYFMIGKCIVYSEDQATLATMYPCTTVAPNHEKTTRYEHGFCETGFSAAYRKFSKTAVMGAVGGKDQRGSVILENEPDSLRFDFASADQSGGGDQTGGGFYLGYAVTYGNFFSQDPSAEAIAGSIPRFEYTGKVIIYTPDLAVKQSIFPPTTVRQKREYIYFGASVCAVDVNGDGFTDLIVGAPFYSDRVGDEGRVYIYLSTKTRGADRQLSFPSGDKSIDPGLRGENNPGARFGWAIAKAGDLNFDGIDDFIVGAPQDQPDIDGDGFGNGAIYIYNGRRDGRIEKYKQKISAKTMEKLHAFSQFGYAVAGNVDTNGDEYPDVAIGAWESNRVLLLRTRPVMSVTAALTLSQKEIAVENFTANCEDKSGRQCLDVELCFSYQGKSVTGQQELRYLLELDMETSSTPYKRVYFSEGGRKVFEKTNNIILTGKNHTACVNFTQIYVEQGSRLTDALRQGTTDIVFSVKYELVNPPDCKTTSLCPVLDDSQTHSVSEKAILVFNCTDNTCDYDLKVNVSLNRDEIVIGESNNILIARVELSNSDEVSYNPEVRITHDPSLQFVRISFPDKSFRIGKQPVPRDNTTTVSELFRLQGPLDKNQKVVFELHYSTQQVLGRHRKLYIDVKATGASGQEKNEKDNNATVSIQVRREVIMKITGTSVPKLINYPASAPPLNIKTVGNKTDFSSVNVSAIGPTVEVTVELTNEGPSDLQSVNFQITYPLKDTEGKDRGYIVYPIAISEKGNGLCKNKDDVLNPENLNLTESDVSILSRRKREVKTLRARTTQRGTFSCHINELRTEERFVVTFKLRLWINTLVQHYAKDLVVKIEANAAYTDSLTDKKYTKVGSVDIQVSPENPPGKSKSTPVWVIVVAVLGGVLLLAIFILALFKLGFFKRNRPPQDISDPQTDDVPPVVAS